MQKGDKKLPKGISLRNDGRYMGRFRYKGEDYIVYDYDLKKATKKLADLKYEVEHGIYIKESDITLNEWFETWMRDFKEKTVKPGTREVYRNTYNGCIKKPLGKKLLKEIRLEHIQRLYNNMADSYAEGTIRLVGVILQGLFRQAMRAQIISSDPIPLATMPRARERKERKVLTMEEQKLFLDYAKKYSRYYPLFAFALQTGCRNGEARALEWKDIDFDNKCIHITGTLKYVKGIGTYKGTPKSKSSKRDIPMLDVCYQLLRQQEEEQRKNKELVEELWKPMKGLEDLVFTQNDGMPIGRESVSSELAKVINKIRSDGYPIDDFTFHSLRHTFATRGIENGIALKTMQSILGHSQYSMTADLYSHVLYDFKAEELNKINHIF